MAEEERRIMTTSIDNQTYKERRDIFLNELAEFKSGGIHNGIHALNHLYEMYFIKPMIFHIKKNKMASAEFIASIDNLRKELIMYLQDHAGEKINPLVSDTDFYMRLDDKMDDIIQRFYVIMSEVGCI